MTDPATSTNDQAPPAPSGDPSRVRADLAWDPPAQLQAALLDRQPPAQSGTIQGDPQ